MVGKGQVVYFYLIFHNRIYFYWFPVTLDFGRGRIFYIFFSGGPISPSPTQDHITIHDKFQMAMVSMHIYDIANLHFVFPTNIFFAETSQVVSQACLGMLRDSRREIELLLSQNEHTQLTSTTRATTMQRLSDGVGILGLQSL